MSSTRKRRTALKDEIAWLEENYGEGNLDSLTKCELEEALHGFKHRHKELLLSHDDLFDDESQLTSESCDERHVAKLSSKLCRLYITEAEQKAKNRRGEEDRTPRRRKAPKEEIALLEDENTADLDALARYELEEALSGFNRTHEELLLSHKELFDHRSNLLPRKLQPRKLLKEGIARLEEEYGRFNLDALTKCELEEALSGFKRTHEELLLSHEDSFNHGDIARLEEEYGRFNLDALTKCEREEALSGFKSMHEELLLSYNELLYHAGKLTDESSRATEAKQKATNSGEVESRMPRSRKPRRSHATSDTTPLLVHGNNVPNRVTSEVKHRERPSKRSGRNYRPKPKSINLWTPGSRSHANSHNSHSSVYQTTNSSVHRRASSSTNINQHRASPKQWTPGSRSHAGSRINRPQALPEKTSRRETGHRKSGAGIYSLTDEASKFFAGAEREERFLYPRNHPSGRSSMISRTDSCQTKKVSKLLSGILRKDSSRSSAISTTDSTSSISTLSAPSICWDKQRTSTCSSATSFTSMSTLSDPSIGYLS